MTDLMGFLEEQGCFSTRHSGSSLGSHLLNTYTILQAVKAPEEVALAGGLHSIYGTNSFKKQTISSREQLASIFGCKTERLVWMFCSLKRPRDLETMPDEGGKLKNRRTGELICLDDQDVYDLRLIEAANLLEQGSTLADYPKICATMERQMGLAG